MSVNKFNSEGYYDPTVFQALTNIEKEQKQKRSAGRNAGFRPLVYICSPYRGDVENNIINARKYSRYALDKNTIPLAPHLLYPQFMDDNNPAERDLACHKINLVLICKCHELWVFGDKITEGMDYEISVAERKNIKVRYIKEV